MSEELKTLKDFIEEANVRGANKTHQDVANIWYDILAHKLKAESVKWIKSRIRICQDCNMINIDDYEEKPIICDEHKFWIDRFNLTSEDLKDE